MKIIAALILFATLSFGSQARADFADGADAFERRDYATALQEWRPLAEEGDAAAQFSLGVMYYYGQGVRQDYEAAMTLYRRAAAQDHAGAQFNLGIMYLRGEGVPEDDEEGLKWLHKAAEQGLVEAQFSLGYMHYDGDDGGQNYLLDYKEAMKWFRKAAEQGHVGAQFHLSDMYDFGKGVPADDKLSYMWASISAANGSETGAEYREILSERMTPEAINQARDMAWRCVFSYYKDC